LIYSELPPNNSAKQHQLAPKWANICRKCHIYNNANINKLAKYNKFSRPFFGEISKKSNLPIFNNLNLPENTEELRKNLPKGRRRNSDHPHRNGNSQIITNRTFQYLNKRLLFAQLHSQSALPFTPKTTSVTQTKRRSHPSKRTHIDQSKGNNQPTVNFN
jgi:hypothetical protein